MTDDAKPKSSKRKPKAASKPRAKKAAKPLAPAVAGPEARIEVAPELEALLESEAEDGLGALTLPGALLSEGELETELESEDELESELESEAEGFLGAATLPGALLGEGEFETELENGVEPQAELEGEPPGASSPDSGTWDTTILSQPDAQDGRPPAKLERLQKIIAQAGVASRRRAEELIQQGRVQVNGKIVTELGSKADAARDHIRVDGKLLHGPERPRYFVLNKPRGYVTTVKDPEGRPTVMQFIEKMAERLYPVGRLDYRSEGLLLVTNDGELANRLTKAASGIEKTYLVKVAGQPTEAQLDLLRTGVSIERSAPGSPQVRTSPARIRQVRQGDNPWFEVVLIEGRNRELRKMFQEIGHFVEKIRRVGYGPLVLDQEPGHLRELDPKELELLRQAAEGKLRTPKSKEIRRRNLADAAQLPTLPPRATRPTWKKEDRPSRPPSRFPARRTGESHPHASKPFGDWPASTRTHDAKLPAGRAFNPKPGPGKTYGARPAPNKPASGKPTWSKQGGSSRLSGKDRHAAPRRTPQAPIEDLGPGMPSRLHIEPSEESARPERIGTSPNRPGSRPHGPGRSSSGRSTPRPPRNESGFARPFTTSSGKPRPGGARPSSKPGVPTDRSSSVGWKSGVPTDRSSSVGWKSGVPTDRSSSVGWKPGKPAGRSSGSRPSSRPFESMPSGSSQPFTPSKRPVRRPEGEGPFTPRHSGPHPPKPVGWKPKLTFGGPSKPASGSRSRPKPGGFSKSGFKGKPSGKRLGGKQQANFNT